MRSETSRWLRPFVVLLASVGLVSALVRYVLPLDVHVALLAPVFGDYATEQLPVLAAHPVSEHLHRLGGTAYFVLGLLQFSPRLRSRWPALHRLGGRVFVAVSLVVAATGIYMGLAFPFADGERVPTVLFGAMMAFATLRALWHVLRREYAVHREWMIRGFAVGLGIGAIRVIGVPLVMFTDLPDRLIIVASFWLGWLSSVAVAEIWIRATRPVRAPVAASPASLAT